ncbi:Hypothetical protein SMAX5B_007541 [Scophthalmus maximus]|uniref:Secreted protein n=1 Tax=Scophthalmus maximus TaxID=52904 RepID=A0A2U9BNK1_SCOMX|nr:Hypothetical protein SMAX5B_007541 [Scophthalmus maximus]
MSLLLPLLLWTARMLRRGRLTMFRKALTSVRVHPLHPPPPPECPNHDYPAWPVQPLCVLVSQAASCSIKEDTRNHPLNVCRISRHAPKDLRLRRRKELVLFPHSDSQHRSLRTSPACYPGAHLNICRSAPLHPPPVGC